MKKKNLKFLDLNKKSISSLQNTSKITGGTQGSCFTPCPKPSKLVQLCPASVIDGPGCNSENGCTTGTDQTMTCPHYSCACNQ